MIEWLILVAALVAIVVGSAGVMHSQVMIRREREGNDS